jgi:hypothetical protein
MYSYTALGIVSLSEGGRGHPVWCRTLPAPFFLLCIVCGVVSTSVLRACVEIWKGNVCSEEDNAGLMEWRDVVKEVRLENIPGSCKGGWCVVCQVGEKGRGS